MLWDAEAYAEGICRSAAGSSIETLVDVIDATIATLDDAADLRAGAIVGNGKFDDDDRERAEEVDMVHALQEQWRELRAAIAKEENDEVE